MKNFFFSLLDLLLPPVCLCCGRPLAVSTDILFCSECLGQLRLIATPLCPRCGRAYLKAAGGDHPCATCLTKKWHFSAARAVLLYEEPAKTIIHRFKYQGKTACLQSLSRLMAHLPHIAGFVGDVDSILPVPLHGSRLRERGFNQAQLLARAFFPKDRRLRADILRRVRATQPQTGFNGVARRRNLKNAFAVTQPEQIHGKKILLVDDVFTTGTTADECAKILKKSGAAEVRVLTLARVNEE